MSFKHCYFLILLLVGAVLGYMVFGNLDHHLAGGWFKHRGEVSTGLDLVLWWVVKLACSAALGSVAFCIPCLFFVEKLAPRAGQFKTFFMDFLIAAGAIACGPPRQIFQPPRAFS